MADNILKAIMKFELMVEALKHVEHHALDKAGERLVKHIKDAIGTYEYDWPQLKEATIDHKGGRNTPLLEEGTLRDSYKHEVHNQKLTVGSEDKRAVFFEYGTSKMPPRPVIGPTWKKYGSEAISTIGISYAEVLKGVLLGHTISSILSETKGTATIKPLKMSK